MSASRRSLPKSATAANDSGRERAALAYSALMFAALIYRPPIPNVFLLKRPDPFRRALLVPRRLNPGCSRNRMRSAGVQKEIELRGKELMGE